MNSNVSRVLKHDHKNKFSKLEDQMLTQLVSIYNTDWGKIAQYMPNRTGRQCRERWNHYLAPHISFSPWTQIEDDLLLKKYQELGPKWKEMVPFFQGRTDVSLKTRCNRLLRIAQRVAQTKAFPPSFQRNISQISIPFTNSNEGLETISDKSTFMDDFLFDEFSIFDSPLTCFFE